MDRRMIEQYSFDGAGAHLLLHVLHDSPFMRAASATVSDRLRSSLYRDVEVRTLWSDFRHLADVHYSREAAEVAAHADVVILATVCQEALPGTVAAWLSSWICQRQKPHTALCGLFLTPASGRSTLPRVAEVLSAAARLTGRAWLPGWVGQESSVVAGPRLGVVPLNPHPADFDTPVCHGFNG